MPTGCSMLGQELWLVLGFTGFKAVNISYAVIAIRITLLFCVALAVVQLEFPFLTPKLFPWKFFYCLLYLGISTRMAFLTFFASLCRMKTYRIVELLLVMACHPLWEALWVHYGCVLHLCAQLCRLCTNCRNYSVTHWAVNVTTLNQGKVGYVTFVDLFWCVVTAIRMDFLALHLVCFKKLIQQPAWDRRLILLDQVYFMY